MGRGHPIVVLSAAVTLVMVGLLDLLTPSDVSFGQLYVVPVIMLGWTYGWSAAIGVAVVASAIELAVDSPILRPTEIGEPVAVLAWNALSSFLAFSLAGVVTDRFRSERERLKAVTAERTRLLRLLEREFPRPLRAIDWFARTFEEAMDRQAPIPTKLREQFSSLRHHSRELRFLATDLLRIGRVRSGDLEFQHVRFELGPLVKEAADETMDRNRVIVRIARDGLAVSADPEAIRHAISAIIGRLVESSATDLVDVLVRDSGDDVAIELTSREGRVGTDELELADLLVTANGGRITVAPPASGTRIHVYFPRAALTSAPSPTAREASTRG